MDINTLRAIVTVATFAVFIGILAWAWSSRNAQRFDEAARLPFMQEDLDGQADMDSVPKQSRIALNKE